MAETEQQAFVPDVELLNKLAPTAEELYNRHIKKTGEKLWVPDFYIPHTYAKDFDQDAYDPDEPWQNEELPITQELRSALEVNLLTEDNLPEYYADLLALFGLSGIWRKWARRWTSEEMRHSIVLRGGLAATRLVDPVLLESDRMQQVSDGVVPRPDSTLEGFIYVTLQELATRISHHNTAKELLRQTADVPIPQARAAVEMFADGMKRTGFDENYHFLFYGDLSLEAMKLETLRFFQGAAHVARGFKMPGTGIRDFKSRSEDIMRTRVIYDASIQYEQVMRKVFIDMWHIDTFTDWGNKTPAEVRAIEEARQEVLHVLKVLARAARSENAIYLKNAASPEK